MFRRIMVVALGSAGVFLIPMLSTQAAAAGTSGTGTYSCSSGSGTVKFKPSWTDTGIGNVTASVSISYAGCSGGTPVPSTVKMKGTFTFPNGGSTTGTFDCINRGFAAQGSLRFTYTPKVNMSSLANVTWGMSTAAGFASPGPMTGSYPVASGNLSGEFYEGQAKGDCVSGVRSIPLILAPPGIFNF